MILMYSMYFVVVTPGFQLLAKQSLATLGCLHSLDWTGLLDWTTGLSLKSRAYRFNITCGLIVQCMRQDKWSL